MTPLLDRAQAETQLELGLFAHLLERMPLLMRPDQVQRAIGWSRSTIYELCEAQDDPARPGRLLPPLLECHALPGRDREAKQITRRSVAALLLRTARYEAADFAALLTLTLPTLTRAQLLQMHAGTTAELARRPL